MNLIFGLLIVCSYSSMIAMEQNTSAEKLNLLASKHAKEMHAYNALALRKKEKQSNKLVFSVAQKGEDVSVYKKIACDIVLPLIPDLDNRHQYENFVNDMIDTHDSAVGRILIKVQNKEESIGWIAVDASPSIREERVLILSHNFAQYIDQYLDFLKEKYSFVKIASTIGLDAETCKKIGWVEEVNSGLKVTLLRYSLPTFKKEF